MTTMMTLNPFGGLLALAVLSAACTPDVALEPRGAQRVAADVTRAASPSGFQVYPLVMPVKDCPGLDPSWPCLDTGVATAINNSGLIVGVVEDHLYGQYGAQATRWANGVPALLPHPSGHNWTIAEAVNATGVAVGWGRKVGSNFIVAIKWDASGATILPTSGQGWAYDINDAGTIVGFEITRAGLRRAVKWVNGTKTVLAPPGATESEAHGINYQGDIAGWVRQGTPYATAYIWEASGAHYPLPRLYRVTNDYAYDINNLGWVVGQTSGTAFRSGPPNGMALLGWGNYTLARAVSPAGRVVGFDETIAGTGAVFSTNRYERSRLHAWEEAGLAKTYFGNATETLPVPPRTSLWFGGVRGEHVRRDRGIRQRLTVRKSIYPGRVEESAVRLLSHYSVGGRSVAADSVLPAFGIT